MTPTEYEAKRRYWQQSTGGTGGVHPSVGQAVVCIFCGWPQLDEYGRRPWMSVKELAEHFARTHGRVLG